MSDNETETSTSQTPVLTADLLKEWLKLNNELNILKDEVKKRRNRKNEITKTLTTTMSEANIDEFETKNGDIISCGNQVTKQYIGKRYLIETIGAFFSHDPYLAKELIEYILDNREVKEKKILKHKIPKPKKNKKEKHIKE